jgi:hypothetical protein
MPWPDEHIGTHFLIQASWGGMNHNKKGINEGLRGRDVILMLGFVPENTAANVAVFITGCF